MDWKTKKFIVKERNILKPEFNGYEGIELAIQDLAVFHKAKDIAEVR